MKGLGSFIFACSLVAYVAAHSCLVSPPQRGGFPANTLNMNGSAACGLDDAKMGPCGGAKMGDPVAIYKVGEKYSVTFQKNLDHFYKSNPGNWTLNLWRGSDKPIQIFSIRDSGAIRSGEFVTQENVVLVPKRMAGGVRAGEAAIIQLIYYTNNPGAPPIFWQCADIMIM